MVKRIIGKKKGELKMGAPASATDTKNTSTPAASLERAFEELKVIKQGKKQTSSWWDFANKCKKK